MRSAKNHSIIASKALRRQKLIHGKRGGISIANLLSVDRFMIAFHTILEPIFKWFSLNMPQQSERSFFNRFARLRSRSRVLILILCITTACFTNGEELIAQSPHPKKQRQKILNLQKKLEAAAKEKEKAESDIERLQREIDEAKLSLIRRRIDDYEKRKETQTTLFMEEREELYRLVQSKDSSKALEAQLELDRILRMITELSDEKKNAY